jgi:hypothetical protein
MNDLESYLANCNVNGFKLSLLKLECNLKYISEAFVNVYTDDRIIRFIPIISYIYISLFSSPNDIGTEKT